MVEAQNLEIHNKVRKELEGIVNTNNLHSALSQSCMEQMSGPGTGVELNAYGKRQAEKICEKVATKLQDSDDLRPGSIHDRNTRAEADLSPFLKKDKGVTSAQELKELDLKNQQSILDFNR